MALQKVDLNKAYRLINHGPTLIICASHEGVEDVMSASWVCPLDYDKITAVVASGSFTRSPFEKSGKFGLCVPFFKDTALIARLGTTSMHSDKNKLAGVEMFYENGVPLLKECAQPTWFARSSKTPKTRVSLTSLRPKSWQPTPIRAFLRTAIGNLKI